MPENPRYRLVQARRTADSGRTPQGWCWSIMHVRTGHLVRQYWLHNRGGREYTQALVDRLNDNGRRYHHYTWENRMHRGRPLVEMEWREILDA